MGAATNMKTETLDVVIIGAGLSGIGAAVHLQRECPGKSYTILETRSAMGGTWDLFRYPGIRSDSDMYTLGYNFKPWTNAKSIADGASIRDYIRDTARENGIDQRIRYQHKVVAANWNSRSARWTLEVQQLESGESFLLECQFVICCAGYYKYEQGFTPEFSGREQFKGQIIHPQFWPQNLDYTGKNIVVIGSGATAVTLVPALTDKAAHVTMLQRSPSYVMSMPERDVISNNLRKVLPETWVYSLARARNVLLSMGLYNFSRHYPERMRRFLLSQVEKQVGPDVDIKHFSPNYSPWDERLCAVPDGDMFKQLKAGRASVVTDHIDCFTADGIKLKSGEELQADIIVTATGLEVQMLGGIGLTLDGQPVKLSEKLYYKGAMIEDVPNMVMVFGYTNSSWTLKADLILEYFCKVMNHMQKQGFEQCTARNNDSSLEREPFLNMSSGYVQRALAMLPQQGAGKPWRLYQNYLKDFAAFKLRPIRDKGLVFSNPIAHNYGYGEATMTVAPGVKLAG